MIRRIAIPQIIGACLLLTLLASAPAAASTGPAWKLTVTPDADYFLPGPSDLNAAYTIEAENVGDEPSAGQIAIKDVLPAGLTAHARNFYYSGLAGTDLSEALCPTFVKCEFPGPEPYSVQPGQRLIMVVGVAVASNVSGPIVDQVKISGGGAPAAEATATNEVNADPPFGFHSFDAPVTDSSKTNPYSQAGGHPYQFTTEINFSTETQTVSQPRTPGEASITPVRDPKDISVDLPPGLIANPGAIPRCTIADFFAHECPLSTAVGTVGIRAFGQAQGGLRELIPLYNLIPAGAYPAELGTQSFFAFLLTASVRSGSDYGVTITSAGTAEAAINRVRVTTWGVPADPSHDGLRGKSCLRGTEAAAEFNRQSPEQNELECASETGINGGKGGPAGTPLRPFLIMPTECSGAPLTFGARYNSWQVPGEYATTTATVPAVDSCNLLSFEPTIEARPTTNLADSPSGFELNLHVPQNEDPTGVATPELKEAVVKLPAGLTVNPSSANGLAACSEAQIGLTSAPGATPAHFAEAPAACPDAAKLGSVELDTPLLNEPLDGFVYLATPHHNPFDALLAGYIVLEGQGLIIKLPGRFQTDPVTGQITASFLENPQLPFEDFKLHFFGGARGALRTPATCGSFEVGSLLTPYSAPESGPPATPASNFATSVAENGGPCPTSAGQEPNAPRFHAGTETPQAGIYSPFALKLVREDGSQEIKGIETTLPPGLVGKLAGLSYCSDAQIAQAEARRHEGGGAAEQAAPSCPPGSEVGSVEVGAGAGPTPLYVSGRAYLAGPYKGAPLSLAIITPAVAGPFDLGTVVVRTALHVNPETAQIRAVSDPIPTILEGIPLDVRSITLKMSRPNFTLNPTNCSVLGFTGSALSVLEQSAPLAQRFQVGGCSALGFKPKLALSLRGGAQRGAHPALKAVLTMPPGGANLAKARVTLPRSEFLDQGHIGTVCTRVQFAAGAVPGEGCPAASVYGHARAITPLLDQPLEGPVYLRSSSHKLPDLVATLNGQIDVALDGRIDSVRGGIRNSFEVLPDAPVSRFTLEMKGGKKGLLVNSTNICARPNRATVDLSGQNGKVSDTKPALRVKCPKARRGHGRHHRGHGRHRRAG